MYRITEYHVARTDDINQIIARLLPQLDIDHKPIRVYRGGILITLYGRYQPCASCGRPRTIAPEDGREYCQECDLRSREAGQ